MLIFGAVVIALTLMEGGTRLIAPQPLVRAYNTPDPDLGTYIAPNADYVDPFTKENRYRVRTNAHGFRMHEEVDLSHNRSRVLVYGDSFTFGWGVDLKHTYFAKIKSAIETIVPAAQLINAGVGGYSSGHVKKLMERHLPMLTPRAIIYFFNNNDLVDNMVTDINYQVTAFEFDKSGTVTLHDIQPFAPWKRFALNYTPYGWLNQHSHLFVMTKAAAKQVLGWKRHLSTPQLATPLPIPQAQFTTALPEHSDQAAQIQRWVSVSEAHVRRLTGLASSATIPIIFVWVPAPNEMFPIPDGAAKSSLLRAGRDMLTRLASEVRGMAFIDTATMVPTGPKWLMQKGRLRLSDGHFNPAGNAWYADLILPRLRTLIVPHL